MKDKILAEIERRMDNLYPLLPDASKVVEENISIEQASTLGKYVALESLIAFINSLPEENVDKVPYDKLSKMLDESLAKETKESWEEFLGAYKCNIVPKPIECDSNCRDCPWSVKPEEPVGEDLEEAAEDYAYNPNGELLTLIDAFKAGAKWQKEHVWHSTKDKPTENRFILFVRLADGVIESVNSMWYWDCDFCNNAMQQCDKWCYVEDIN